MRMHMALDGNIAGSAADAGLVVRDGAASLPGSRQSSVQYGGPIISMELPTQRVRRDTSHHASVAHVMHWDTSANQNKHRDEHVQYVQ